MRQLVFLIWLLVPGVAAGQDMPLSLVLIDGEGWKEVKLKNGSCVGPLAADHKGDLLVSVSRGSRSRGSRLLGIKGETPETNDFWMHAACVDDKARFYWRFEYEGAVYLHAFHRDLIQLPKQTGDVAFSPAGKLYFIDRETKSVMLHGRKQPVAEKLGDPAGLAFWNDGGTLVVGDAAGSHLYAFRVKDDGSLDAKEAYYTLRTRPKQPSGVAQLILDDKRRLYAATTLGVQVFDPTGRMCGVINPPTNHPVTAVALAGAKRDQLYVVCGGKLYQRKTKAKASWPPDAK